MSHFSFSFQALPQGSKNGVADGETARATTYRINNSREVASYTFWKAGHEPLRWLRYGVSEANESKTWITTENLLVHWVECGCFDGDPGLTVTGLGRRYIDHLQHLWSAKPSVLDSSAHHVLLVVVCASSLAGRLHVACGKLLL